MKHSSAALRILCVDDDAHVLRVLSEGIGEAGHTVDTAIDGAHALQKIATAERPYDLLVVDERMPNVGGWRFVVQARAGGYAGKIVVFSAYLNDEERARFRNVEVDAILDKPLRPSELLRVIEELPERAVR